MPPHRGKVEDIVIARPVPPHAGGEAGLVRCKKRAHVHGETARERELEHDI